MTERNLTKEQLANLFEMQTLGMVAAAFIYGDKQPTNSQWAMLRGERHITMQDIGEIGHLTGHNMHLTLTDHVPAKRKRDLPND